MPRTSAPPGSRLGTSEDLAKALGISRRQVYDLANEHQIPAWKIGGVWRFDIAEVLVHLRREAVAAAEREAIGETP